MNSLDIIAGARPNFMKIGPIIHAIHKHNLSNDNRIQYRLIHTGQHYDKKMSESFFEQLNIPQPDINLGVGSGTQAYQGGTIMMRYEQALENWKPDLCLVVGDVTSTMACAVVAKKAWMKLAHVEGGIRSGDLTMPEEINRIVTDSITDYFFTTSEYANENLRKEGTRDEQIFFVGNTMIDSLLANLDRLQKPEFFDQMHLTDHDYLVTTLHRPSNVDTRENLDQLLSMINDQVENTKVIFPMHPRTHKVFSAIHKIYPNLYITEPLSYLEFIYLVKNSKGIITDSGGITEEATLLQVPCMTLRNSTERPETVDLGTNEMVGTKPENIVPYLHKMVRGQWKIGKTPPLWDGKTAERIVEIITKL